MRKDLFCAKPALTADDLFFELFDRLRIPIKKERALADSPFFSEPGMGLSAVRRLAVFESLPAFMQAPNQKQPTAS